MNPRKMALVAALGLPLVLAGSFAANVWAHGAASSPPDRGFFCRFNDGSVESPRTAGCQAAKAAQGTGPVYNFNAVLIPNANQRGIDAVPDGQLCSAGQQTYRGFNLAPAQAGYAATPIKGGTQQFRYLGTAPHKTDSFTIFISKPSYDGSRPLMKSDVDMVAKVTNAVLAGDTFTYNVTLPDRPAGSKAVIFEIWSRVAQESGEAYFTCADVVYQ
jgi:chitin-binding protein